MVCVIMLPDAAPSVGVSRARCRNDACFQHFITKHAYFILAAIRRFGGRGIGYPFAWYMLMACRNDFMGCIGTFSAGPALDTILRCSSRLMDYPALPVMTFPVMYLAAGTGEPMIVLVVIGPAIQISANLAFATCETNKGIVFAIRFACYADIYAIFAFMVVRANEGTGGTIGTAVFANCLAITADAATGTKGRAFATCLTTFGAYFCTCIAELTIFAELVRTIDTSIETSKAN